MIENVRILHECRAVVSDSTPGLKNITTFFFLAKNIFCAVLPPLAKRTISEKATLLSPPVSVQFLSQSQRYVHNLHT